LPVPGRFRPLRAAWPACCSCCAPRAD